MTSGSCHYESRCQFAHGTSELRLPPLHFEKQLSKEQKCRLFSENGFCPFGENCKFIHDYAELNKVRRKVQRCRGYALTGYCPYGDACKYLHSGFPEQTTDLKNIKPSVLPVSTFDRGSTQSFQTKVAGFPHSTPPISPQHRIPPGSHHIAPPPGFSRPSQRQMNVSSSSSYQGTYSSNHHQSTYHPMFSSSKVWAYNSTVPSKPPVNQNSFHGKQWDSCDAIQTVASMMRGLGFSADEVARGVADINLKYVDSTYRPTHPRTQPLRVN